MASPQTPTPQTGRSLLQTYAIGFVLSLVLTFLVYGFVQNHTNGHGTLTHQTLIVTVFALAVIQLIVQLVFFLHIGRKGQNWNVATLGFAVVVVLILVIGSLWIMTNLDYNMMHKSPTEVNEYMKDQDSL